VIKPNKSAKQQALAAIELLKEVLPIERCQMRVRLEMAAKVGKQVKKAIESLVAEFEDEDWGADCELVMLIDPGNYRAITDSFQDITKGKGSLEIVDMQVTEDGDDAF
jgi:ribosome maturation protein SDO1